MSSTMRKTGKRALAGMAAGALGLALVPFVGAGVSQAAITTNQTGVTVPGAGSNVIPRVISANGIVSSAYYVANTTATVPFQVVGAADDSVYVAADDTVVGGDDTLSITSFSVTSALGTGSLTEDDSALRAQLSGTSSAMTGVFSFGVPNTPGSQVNVVFPPAFSNAGTSAGGIAVTAPAREASPGTTAVGPVRAAATPSSVPFARVSWNNSSGDDTIGTDNIVVLTSAPTGATMTTSTGTLGVNRPVGDVTLTTTDGVTYFEVKASTPGTYSGFIQDVSDPAEQRAFSFTTAGAPTTMSLSPTSASAAVGQASGFLVELRDASGNLTQAGSLDSVLLSSSPAAGATFAPASPITAAQLADGTHRFTYANSAAGTYTVTATPQGTLGMSAQTAVVTVAGTVSDDSVSNLTVTTPAVAVNAGTVDGGNRTAAVPAGTSSISVLVNGDANTQYRFQATAQSTGSVINGVSNPTTDATSFKTNITLDASGRATIDLTLAGTALTANQAVTLEQIKADGSNIDNGPADIVITQTTPVIDGDSVTAAPRGTLVSKLNTPLNVEVTVENQFEVGAANYTVQVYRNSLATAAIGSGVTDTSGNVTLSVVNATGAANGTVETYLYRITSPGGVINTVAAAQNLTVTWLENPAISSVTVNTTPATVVAAGVVTAQPLIRVPADGFVSGTVTTYTVNPTTGVPAPNTTIANAGEFFTLTPSSAPATNLVVNAPEGVKLVTSLPSDTSPVLWSGGASEVTVGSGTPVYAFATKTGSHTITVTPVGLETPSATVTFTATNLPTNAYSVAASTSSVTVPVNGIQTYTATVTDVFGNVVPGATVEAAASGPVLLAGLTQAATLTMGATSGQATVAVVALAESGTGSIALTATTTGATAWTAAGVGYTPPAGAPAPVLTTATEVIVTTAPISASIVLSGERATVRGKSGIVVDGVTTGLAGGTTVVPFIKFPGQISYTQGTASRSVTITNEAEQVGEFTWQRRTGKKTYVYFATEGGDTRSSRIIIPAK